MGCRVGMKRVLIELEHVFEMTSVVEGADYREHKVLGLDDTVGCTFDVFHGDGGYLRKDLVDGFYFVAK